MTYVFGSDLPADRRQFKVSSEWMNACGRHDPQQVFPVLRTYKRGQLNFADLFTPWGEWAVCTDWRGEFLPPAPEAAPRPALVAFPDYPAADLPALPPTFEDESHAIEQCPMFESNGLWLRIFCDFPNAADREFPESPRFTVHSFDSDGETAVLHTSDDWADVLAFIVGRIDSYVAENGAAPSPCPDWGGYLVETRAAFAFYPVAVVATPERAKVYPTQREAVARVMELRDAGQIDSYSLRPVADGYACGVRAQDRFWAYLA